MRGGSMSGRTVTWNEHAAVLPQLSIARQRTVVLPNGNSVPEGGWQITSTPGHPPITVGAGYCQTRLLVQVQIC